MLKKALTAIILGLAIVTEATAGSIKYTYAGNDYGEWGTKKKETYDVAIRIDNPALIGKKITAVNASIFAIEGISNTSIWLSKELTLNKKVNAPDIMSIPVTPTQYGDMKVTLETPYTLTEDGVYIGYSVTVDDLTEDNLTPLILADNATENGFYLHTSRTVLKWMNYGVERLAASAVIEVTIEGSFPDNSLDIQSLPTIYGKAGATGTAAVKVMNCGLKDVNEIDYTYTIGDITKSANLKLASPIKTDFVNASTAMLTFEMPEEVGSYTLDLSIDKINGEENVATSKTADAQLVTVTEVPRHRAVMEEYTGTWCGWCPRGWFALEKMNSLYGSDFIGLAYHYDDPMATISPADYPAAVDGFPSATIDRGPVVDPYYGANFNNEFGIETEWKDACDVFSPAVISLYAWWADAEKTSIDAVSFTRFVMEENDVDYRLSYVLCADDLHSTDEEWDQHNYFPDYASEYVKSGLYELCEMPATINDLHFNEVVLVANEPEGIIGSLPESTKLDETTEDHYTFNISEEIAPLIQNPAKLFVVAMVVDGTTGKIINAIKSPVTFATGIDTVRSHENTNAVAVRYTDLQGRTVKAPVSGIYVKTVKYSDGTTKSEKMFVK